MKYISININIKYALVIDIDNSTNLIDSLNKLISYELMDTDNCVCCNYNKENLPYKNELILNSQTLYLVYKT